LEPEVRAYLIRILNTLSVGLLWMISNSTAGIMYGYAFWEKKMKLGNIIFYIWFIISLALLLWYMIRLWKKPLNIPY
jgi:hypothetical protein